MARKNKTGKIKAGAVIGILVFIVLVIVITTPLLKKYTPSKAVADYNKVYGLDSEDAMLVVVNAQQAEKSGILRDGQVYVDYDTVHASMNSRFYWDDTEQVLRYTLPDRLISVSPDTTSYTVGKEKQDAAYNICFVQDDTMYLALDFVKNYTDLRYESYENPNRVDISTEWGDLSYHKLKKNTQLRVKGGIKSAIVKEVSKGDLVTLLEEGSSWDKVCTQDGLIGYIKIKALGGEQIVTVDSTFEQPVYDKIKKDAPINLGWHQVTNQTANTYLSQMLSSASGINVISPTWFSLADDTGKISSLASHDYVNACHSQGIEVWALVGNVDGTKADVEKVLRTTSSRDTLVNQLIAAAIQYDLDGINVDFEALKSEVGDGFIQFIRELSLKCANNDIVLSIDNYVPSAYTKLYYRSEQALFADYVILMAYDEYNTTSTEAGPVASLSFVKQGVEDTLKEVPADQLVLGIPLYTRIWKETPSDSSETGYDLSSEAVSMSEVDSRIAANGAQMTWLEDVGQYYVQYEKDASTYKIWMEDQNSIEEKLKVYQENKLAGVAFWRIGLEKNTIWNVTKDYLK